MTQQQGIMLRSSNIILLWICIIDTAVIALAIVLGGKIGNVTFYFGERQFITYLSALQILTISWFTFQVGKHRFKGLKVKQMTLSCQVGVIIWFVFSLCFIFLAIDELFEIHESMDRAIHMLLNYEETGLSDRIDDLIVCLYGVCGVLFLLLFRKELVKYRSALPALITGLCFVFFMVFLDVLTNRNDILKIIVDSGDVRSVHRSLAIIEDSLKIYAEAFFIGAAIQCFNITRSHGN